MSELPYTVGIVVDPAYGERLRELATRLHTWIVDTPPNRAAAEVIWRTRPSPDLERSVTTFPVDPRRSPAEWCQAILSTVEAHHGEDAHAPPVGTIEVVGTALTPELRAAFEALAFRAFAATPSGFVASSQAAS